MLKEGNKVVLIPLNDGRYAVVKSAPIKVGDKVLVFPLENEQMIAVKSPEITQGDKVLVVPTLSGEMVLKCEAIINYIPEGAQVINFVYQNFEEENK